MPHSSFATVDKRRERERERDIYFAVFWYLSEFSECVTEDITTLLIQQSCFPEEGAGQWVWLVAVSFNIYFPYEMRRGVTQGPWLCCQHRRWQRKVSRSGKRRRKWPRHSVFCARGCPVCRPWSQSPKTSEIRRDLVVSKGERGVKTECETQSISLTSRE